MKKELRIANCELMIIGNLQFSIFHSFIRNPRSAICNQKGFTLLELMISLAILAAMSLGSFIAASQILNSKKLTEDRDEVHHGAVLVLNRISKDLNMAFLVKSKDLLGATFDGEFAFEGSEDRLDFVTFSHLRIIQEAREANYGEVSYFLAADPETNETKVLMRRESGTVDKDLQLGGSAFPLLSGVEALRFEYLDSKDNEFKKAWDSKSVDFGNRLPLAVKVEIEIYLPDEDRREKFSTLAPIELNQGPIGF
jgi:type II secretion system protein J